MIGPRARMSGRLFDAEVEASILYTLAPRRGWAGTQDRGRNFRQHYAWPTSRCNNPRFAHGFLFLGIFLDGEFVGVRRSAFPTEHFLS
jgi:hypothetical protein